MDSSEDLKKLNEVSLRKLREGTGPSDKCICNLLTSDRKKSFGTSLKKAFGISKKGTPNETAHRSIIVPLDTSGRGNKVSAADTIFKSSNTGLHSTKETVKRKSPCGKCGCDENEMVFRHSYANIRITSPDISSICPCPTDCLPDKEKLRNNIKVIVENAQIKSQPMISTQSDRSLAQSESSSTIDSGFD